VSAAPVITMDWTATMLAAAGVAPHAAYPMDGTNLLPLFDQPDWAPERTLFWRMAHRQQKAVRSGPWKYLAVDDHAYLFDLSGDERERANLKQREPARLAELRQAWSDWAQQMPDIPPEAKVTLVFSEADMPRASH
jgi:arylsulfatase A-like enzyme